MGSNESDAVSPGENTQERNYEPDILFVEESMALSGENRAKVTGNVYYLRCDCRVYLEHWSELRAAVYSIVYCRERP